jgi:hypothetical protein
MAKSILFRVRMQRLVAALPAVLALTYLVYQLFHGIVSTPGYIGFLLLFAFTLVGWYEYRKRQCDPTWTLKYQQMWDGMTKERAEAARTIVKNKSNLSKVKEMRDELSSIDPVLDVLEDIGFYMQGDVISPETAHHHFFHWIRGYHQAASEYDWAYRATQRAAWEHIDELYETVMAIEAKKSGKTKEELLDDAEDFLSEESSLDDGIAHTDAARDS